MVLIFLQKLPAVDSRNSQCITSKNINIPKEVKADIFVIGEDWGRKPHNQDVEDFLKSQGKEVVQVKYNPKNSSTKIKKDVLSLHQTGKRV